MQGEETRGGLADFFLRPIRIARMPSSPRRIDGDEKGAVDESGRLAAGDVRARTREPGRLLRVYFRLRGYLKGFLMTFVTIAVTAFVIVYLFTALVRPEWF